MKILKIGTMNLYLHFKNRKLILRIYRLNKLRQMVIKDIYLIGKPEKYYGYYKTIKPIKNGYGIFKNDKFFIYKTYGDGTATIGLKVSKNQLKEILIK